VYRNPALCSGCQTNISKTSQRREFKSWEGSTQSRNSPLRIGTGGELLWKHEWNLRFHKRWRISWITRPLSASQRLCSMEIAKEVKQTVLHIFSFCPQVNTYKTNTSSECVTWLSANFNPLNSKRARDEGEPMDTGCGDVLPAVQACWTVRSPTYIHTESRWPVRNGPVSFPPPQ
jgi:hypothetical protein